MPPTARIVRKSSFTPKPWKNGGGVTYEAIRVPPDGEAFHWRVSVARIEDSGPFSDFAGYHRNMVLLEGDGLKLEFADGGEQRLVRVGDLAQFDGAPAPHCTLLGAACVDFNLMVAKAYTADPCVAWLAGNQVIQAGDKASETTLIFSINGVFEVNIDAQVLGLDAGDLAIISNGSAQITGLQSNPAAKPSAVFFATISHIRTGL